MPIKLADYAYIWKCDKGKGIIKNNSDLRQVMYLDLHEMYLILL